MKQLIKLRYLLSIALVLAPAFSWAMGKKPAGYIPSCDKVNAACVGAEIGEDDLEIAGCGPGKLRFMRFDANAGREQMCLDIAGCGGSLGEAWGVCQEYRNDVVKYKCLKFSGLGPTACPRDP